MLGKIIVKLFSFKFMALLYAVLIFILSSIPKMTPPSLGFEAEDKVYHFIEYAIFSFLLFWAFFKAKTGFFKRHVFLLSSLTGILYAYSDEFHQRFVPGRSYDLYDFLADCLGIILIQATLWIYLGWKGRGAAPKGSS
ncbi:MAG: VanZ family protein [Candidatus Zixiibacteriota bacterium]